MPLLDSIATESVDLIYQDPPFNSSAYYNVLFKAPSGEQSQAWATGRGLVMSQFEFWI